MGRTAIERGRRVLVDREDDRENDLEDSDGITTHKSTAPDS